MLNVQNKSKQNTAWPLIDKYSDKNKYKIVFRLFLIRNFFFFHDKTQKQTVFFVQTCSNAYLKHKFYFYFIHKVIPIQIN